jgi:hypothetical protein
VGGHDRDATPQCLEQVGVVHLAAVDAYIALTEQRIVGRHRLHLRDDRLAVAVSLQRFNGLEIVEDSGVYCAKAELLAKAAAIIAIFLSKLMCSSRPNILVGRFKTGRALPRCGITPPVGGSGKDSRHSLCKAGLPD